MKRNMSSILVKTSVNHTGDKGPDTLFRKQVSAAEIHQKMGGPLISCRPGDMSYSWKNIGLSRIHRLHSAYPVWPNTKPLFLQANHNLICRTFTHYFARYSCAFTVRLQRRGLIAQEYGVRNSNSRSHSRDSADALPAPGMLGRRVRISPRKRILVRSLAKWNRFARITRCF